MSEVKIVGWSAKISFEWSDKPNKFVHLTHDDLPEWLARKIDLFLDGIEEEENAKLLTEEEV